MRILYNSKDLQYKDPFGTLIPGQDCTLRILIPAAVGTTAVECLFQHEDGSFAFSVPMEFDCANGAYQRFQGCLCFDKPGLFFYYFRITGRTGAFRLFKQGDDTNMEAGDLWQVSCVPAGFCPPDWAIGATIYQVFPDRFCRTQSPEGLTAGQLGCTLTGQGVDFIALVIYWAQMGYLLIHLDDNGRVMLHRRMEMGNERGDFEVRLFKSLFGKRRAVDGTSFHFARLSRMVADSTPNIRANYLPGSGNPRIFRLLCMGITMAGGVSLALAIVNDTVWQVLLSLLLVSMGALLSYLTHRGAAAVHLRRKQPFYMALAGSALWLLLGILSSEWGNALLMLICQWLLAFAGAYGGRRSSTGRQNMSEILGLRRHLAKISKEELQQILRRNPDYYYNLAPYALALGVDKAFARQMAGRKLPQCSYLVTTEDGHLTAKEWNQLLRTAAAAMDASNQRSVLEKLLGK